MLVEGGEGVAAVYVIAGISTGNGCGEVEYCPAIVIVSDDVIDSA